jgi:hypothetical protein
MANIASVRFRKPISTLRIKTIIQDINLSYFGNQLEIEFFENENIFEAFSVKIKNYNSYGGTIWVKDNKFFEWKHHMDQLMWWVISTLTSRFICSVNPRVKIRDEGIDTSLDANFHILYPKPLDWILALYRAPFPISVLRTLEATKYNYYFKKHLPEFWKVVQ